MKQAGVYMGLILSLFICFVIPVGGMIFLQVKYKRSVKPFLLGAAAFFVSQMVLRLPLLQYVLPGFGWYMDLQINHYYAYYIFLGLTAGLFEEIARAIVIWFFMKKERRYCDGISFGLGHGGIEAMLFAGISCLSLLLNYILFKSGALNAQAVGMTEAAYQQAAAQLGALTLPAVLIGGVERLTAMSVHVCWSVMIMTGIKKGRTVRYVLAAVATHGIVDASIGFWQAAGVTGYALEGVFAVYALIGLGYMLYLGKDRVYQKEEQKNKG